MATDDPTNKILEKLNDISREIKVLRSDVGKSKTDTTLTTLRLQSIEDGNKAIQTDISDVKSDLRRLEVLHEETDSVIQQIAEGVSPVLEKTTELEQITKQHDDKFVSHDRRLNLLEKTA